MAKKVITAQQGQTALWEGTCIQSIRCLLVWQSLISRCKCFTYNSVQFPFPPPKVTNLLNVK